MVVVVVVVVVMAVDVGLESQGSLKRDLRCGLWKRGDGLDWLWGLVEWFRLWMVWLGESLGSSWRGLSRVSERGC